MLKQKANSSKTIKRKNLRKVSGGKKISGNQSRPAQTGSNKKASIPNTISTNEWQAYYK